MRPPYRAVMALFLLPWVLCACRARGVSSGELPIARPALGAAASPTSACAPYWREAQLDVSFAETPRFEQEYEHGLFSRQMRITDEMLMAHARLDRWTAVFHFASERSRGELHLETVVPWSFRSLAGQTIAWHEVRRQSECVSGGAHPEPILIGEDVLRDEAGRLLFLGVLSAPLGNDGSVGLEPGLTPELQLGWRDVGCAAVDSPGEGQVNAVGLEVRAGAERVLVKVGERPQLRLGGATYRIAVTSAKRPAAGGCGSAAFLIYREDVLRKVEAPQRP